MREDGPRSANLCWASWKSIELFRSDLEGMQPTLRQVPPSFPRFSTHAVCSHARQC